MKQSFVIRLCLQNSTAHGLMHIVLGRTKIQRLTWTLFALTAAAIFLVYLIRNAKKYRGEPTSLALDTMGATFVPPDLHFCNINAFSYHLISNETEEDFKRTEVFLDKMVETAHMKLPYLIHSNPYFWSIFNHSFLYKHIGHKPNLTIFYGDFNHQKQVNLPLEVTSNSEYFSCARLPLRKLKENMTTMDKLHLYIYLDAYQSSIENRTSTFFDMPIQQMNFYVRYPKMVGPQGIIVFVTQPDVYPHEGSHTVLIKPHGHTFIKLRMEQFEKVQTKRHPCQDTDEYIDYYNRLLGGDNTTRFKKSFGDCVIRKQLESMWQNYPDCRCVFYNTPVTLQQKHLNICMNIEEVDTVMKQFECYYQFQKMQFDLDADDCVAEKPCKSLRYSSEVWMWRWLDYGKIGQAIREQLVEKFKASGWRFEKTPNETDDILMNFAVVEITLEGTEHQVVIPRR